MAVHGCRARDVGVLVPPLPGDADLALTAMLDRQGQWHVAAATRRGEASYRVAVDVMMGLLERDEAASVVARHRARRPPP